MTARAAPARAASRLAAIVARVLWVEGAVAVGRRGPSLSDEEARVGFAATLRGGAALELPVVDWLSGAPLPPSSDARWNGSAFVGAGPRACDRTIVLRRTVLERLAKDRASRIAAELQAALDSWSAPERRWRIAGRELLLRRSRPAVMAVINITPDSFSDGGRWNAVAAVERGLELEAAGAELLDVGGESTRPGALPVAAEVELARVLPVIERLARRVAVPISIDTTKAAVARAALAAGASIVNDTSALADDPEMADVVAGAGPRAERASPRASCAGIILMHRRGPPRTMQDDPRYEDCAAEVAEQLLERAEFAVGRGIARDAIVVDPGLGFGKRLADNLDLVAAIGSLKSLGFPVLLGASRKAFLGTITGKPASGRDAATLATTALAFQSGCELVRVHDAAGSVDLVKVLAAVRDGSATEGAP